MKNKKKKQEKKVSKIGNRAMPEDSGKTCGEDIQTLTRRTEDDPMRLFQLIRQELNHSFLKRGLTLLSAQKEMMDEVIKAVLSAKPGEVTAVPLIPGTGKSTLIRAALSVFSVTFSNMDNAIAKRLGGVIVVVEKSSEAHELEALCNQAAGCSTAIVVESANDFNLSQGRCINGTASCYEECLRRACPDYTECPLMQAAGRTQERPILILLHARYQRHMEDMAPFLTWHAGEQAFHRTLLLVDELPNLFETNSISIQTINEAESELDKIKPSYRPEVYREKQIVLSLWNKTVRQPFFRLGSLAVKRKSRTGLLAQTEMETVGFQQKSLEKLSARLKRYAANTRGERMVYALCNAQNYYFSIGQTMELLLPRLRCLHGTHQPATFLFSGTAALSPEVTDNPNIAMLPTRWEESYDRLQVYIQRGDAFNSSKSGLSKAGNFDAAVQWLDVVLPQLGQRHKKILAVTYQKFAETLWQRLAPYHDKLIPYIDGANQIQPKLPYFGGLNGSNLYQEATCVICFGLNRYEPGDYLSRSIALDATDKRVEEMQKAMEYSPAQRLEQQPTVMSMQDITLARDIVQLVFRSALRRHGEATPIELWLLHPPNGVLSYLQDFFGDCRFIELSELPEECRNAMASARQYRGKSTHAAILLQWLNQWDGRTVTPEGIRNGTGLTKAQFKEAKKHPDVRAYFDNYVKSCGTGKNTRYRKQNNNAA